MTGHSRETKIECRLAEHPGVNNRNVWHIYLVKVSTPALADALGETKPEPERVYVVVMERNTPPVRGKNIYH